MFKGLRKLLTSKKGILVCSVLIISVIVTLVLVKSEFKSSASAAKWSVGETYSLGDVVEMDGVSYKCITAHTVYSDDWTPDKTPALWEIVSGSETKQTVKPTEQVTQKPTEQAAVKPTTQATAKPTSNTSVSTSNNGSFGNKIFAPYADMSLYVGTWGDHSFNFAECAKATGQMYYTMAFILNSNGEPAWGGMDKLASGSDDLYMNRINDLRALGGEVMVSFGGANGTELAQAITDVNKLAAAYQKVIDRYDLKWIDLDIEGAAVNDSASIDRRNKAIKIIQQNNKDLTVAYCLPALPSGLTDSGLNVIKNAKDNGVRVDVVNIMAMDYGDGSAPNPSGQMGKYAIKAAESTYSQVTSIGVQTKIGVTPMIGRNDVATEVFTIDDAKELMNWASSTDYVRLLSMWSVTRDNGDLGALDYAVCNSSSLVQNKFDFVNTFKVFNK